MVFQLSALCALGALGVLTGATLADEEMEQGKLDVLKGEISQLQEQLRDTSAQRDRLANELRAAEIAAADIRARILAAERNIGEREAELSELEGQRRGVEANSNNQLRRISADIAAAHRLGRQEPIKLLFNMENPHSLNRNLRYYDYFLAARRDRLVRYRQTLKDLDILKAAIDNNRAELAANREQLQQQQLELNTKRQQREQLMAEIDRHMQTGSHRLRQLSAEQRALEAVIKTLDEKRTAQTAISVPAEPESSGAPSSAGEQIDPSMAESADADRTDEPSAANDAFSRQQGRLPWPTEGVVVHQFGAARAASLSWQGWLMRAEAGAPVRAIHRGVVVFADYLRGHGLLLIIDHGGGYLSLYAHNQALFKRAGDQVARGDVVAGVGDTGGAGQSALYFEIRRQGQAIDPKPWLRTKT